VWQASGVVRNFDTSWSTLFSGTGGIAWTRWVAAWSLTGLCCSLFLLVTVSFAAWRVRRVWREEPPSARLVWLGAKFCTPLFFTGLFHRWMRYCLARNPVGWLERRRWSGRLITWGWLGAVTCLTSVTLAEPRFSYGEFPFWAYQAGGAFLVGSLTLSAAGSFRRERETGVLELLLVSTLSTDQIISGRLRGLWSQFLPAMALLLGIWLYLACVVDPRGFHTPENISRAILVGTLYAAAFLTGPVIGLYFSLLCRNFITAYAASILAGLVVPWALSILFTRFSASSGAGLSGTIASAPVLVSQIFFQVVLGAVFYGVLWRRLQNRAFPLERSGGG
jgi:hypothetical protein